MTASAASQTPAETGGVVPGLGLGVLGVLGFSFSLPATRLAVEDLDPWLLAFGRAVIAAGLAAAYLAAVPDRDVRSDRDPVQMVSLLYPRTAMAFLRATLTTRLQHGQVRTTYGTVYGRLLERKP